MLMHKGFYKLIFPILLLALGISYCNVSRQVCYVMLSQNDMKTTSSSDILEEPITNQLVAYVDTAASARAGEVNYQMLVVGTYSSDSGFTQLANYTFALDTVASSGRISFNVFQNQTMAISPNSQNIILAFEQDFDTTSKIDIYLMDLTNLSSIASTKILTLNDYYDIFYVLYSSVNQAYILTPSYDDSYGRHVSSRVYVINVNEATITNQYETDFSQLYSALTVDPTDEFTSTTGNVAAEISLVGIPGDGNYMGAVVTIYRWSTYVNYNSLTSSGTSAFKTSLYSRHKLYKLILNPSGFGTSSVSNIIDLHATAEGVLSTSSNNMTLTISSEGGFGGIGAIML